MTVQYLAVMEAMRQGDDETTTALLPHLFKAEHGGEPGGPIMTPALDRARSGQVLRFPRCGVLDDHHFEASQALGNVLLEICQLATMWCLNSGVTEWSRAEIEEEIERNIAFIPVLDALEGQERPPHLTLDAQGGRPGSGDGAAPR